MTFFGLSLMDIIVIVVYFMAMIGIGFWSMRRIKSEEDYFLGGRRFGKLIQIFANFGQATSSDTGPSVATTTYHNGAAGVWSALMMLFATPFYWFTAPWYRRMRCMTLADYYAERYNSKSIGGVYAVMSSIGLCILLSLGFIVLSKTVLAMTPKSLENLTVAERVEYDQAQTLDALQTRDYGTLSGAEKVELDKLTALSPRKSFSYINVYVLIISIVVVVVIYSVAGGLEAAFISDMLQGVFILILSVILVPFAIKEVNLRFGGSGIMDAFHTLHAQKSESFFEIFGSPHNIDFTWYYIAALALMALINASAQANGFVTPSSSKDEFSARFAYTFGSYLKRFACVLWGLTALFAVLLYKNEINDPDLMWGYASRQLLGPLNMGLIGLMIAALMAAFMSTADMMMITTSALLTHSVYRPLVKGKTDKHYVTIGRVLGAFVVVGAAVMTLMSGSLLQVLKLWWEFGVIFSAAMWMGILWKRTNRKAVWVQISLTFVLFFALPFLLPVAFPGLRTSEYLTLRTEQRTLVRHYSAATEEDVSERNNEIAAYEQLPPEKQSQANSPETIVLGDAWSKQYTLPRKSVFWTKGVEWVADGEGGYYRGKGALNLFLVGFDYLGAGLARRPHAFNQTLRILVRTFIPFILLVLVSILTKRSKEEELAAQQVCAKLLTPVDSSPEQDAAAIEACYLNPACNDHLKLFGPKSNWQFRKWTKVDSWGFLANIGVVLLVLALLKLVVSLGSG